MKTAVVYWSGTGNTEIMAAKVADGAKAAGADVSIFTASQFSADMLDGFDCVALGCPSMGDEQLEESEFEPMFLACMEGLKKKKVGLFGSYGWGDGQWMRDWCDRCSAAGAQLYDKEGLMANEAPDDAAQEASRQLGRSLAAWK